MSSSDGDIRLCALLSLAAHRLRHHGQLADMRIAAQCEHAVRECVRTNEPFVPVARRAGPPLFGMDTKGGKPSTSEELGPEFGVKE